MQVEQIAQLMDKDQLHINLIKLLYCALQYGYNQSAILIMKQDHQIKIVDYRNACFQGNTLNQKFQGLGAVLTQDFLFCLATWHEEKLFGPCFVIFPSEKIFYGDFENNVPDGLCCYEMGKQCQVYCIFQQGKMKNRLAAVFPYIQCVLDLQMNENQLIIRQQQVDYRSSQQKWEIIEQAMKIKVPNYIKSFNKFIKQSFMSKFKQVEEIYGEQYFIGFAGEGLGLKFNPNTNFINSIGYYDANKIMKYLGKIIINGQKKVREQGIYSKPQTLIRYQKRPQTIKKVYRDFFRVSINFQNRFLQVGYLQKIQEQFNKLKIKIKDSTTQRIAQQLIQHLDEVQYSQSSPSKLRSQPSSQNRADRYSNYKVMMKNDATIEELKQQLNRSISNNKSKGRSPYKTQSLQPAQLKYRSKTNKKTQLPVKETNSKYIQPFNSSKQQRKPPFRQVTRQINFDFSNLLREDIKNHQQRFNEPVQRRYPIQQNLRTINSNKNSSRSPIKAQPKSLKFKYLQQSNPESEQLDRKFPQRIYSNINPDRSMNYQQENRGYSPYKDRLQKMSHMYDELHQKNTSEYKQYTNRKEPSDYRYQLNKGQGYHYNDEDSMERKIGYVTPMRTVEQPHRSTSKSPIRTYNKLNTQQTFKSKSPRFNGHANYGYFDKNR